MRARLTLAAALAAVVAGQTCPNQCSGNGLCDTGATLECRCNDGWTGFDCNSRACPVAKAWVAFSKTTTGDVHDREVECAGVGDCDRQTGKCACRAGFEGDACERLGCPRACSDHGRCISMRAAAEGFDGFKLVVPPTDYNAWDADRIFGCQCDAGWTGPACAEPECPTGHDPLVTTVGGVPIQSEQQTLTCACPNGCTSGSFLVNFAGRTTSIAYNAVALRSQESAAAARGSGFFTGESLQSRLAELRDWPTFRTVTFQGGRLTACETPGPNIITVQFLNSAGNVPQMEPATGSLRDGGGAVASVLGLTNIEGTTSRETCSKRGACNAGACQCEAGFFTSNGDNGPGVISDCGSTTSIITGLTTAVAACPRANCNGHGVCAGPATYRCTCFTGWSGYGCELATCPKGPAWFDEPAVDGTAHKMLPCSNAGTCDTEKGRCDCESGFTGGACQHLQCPSASVSTICSGHGLCMSLREMAAIGRFNGDYIGSNEVQTITCALTAGSFTLTDAYYETIPISFMATAAAVKAALEALPSITKVKVRSHPYTAPTICSAGGTDITVEFELEHGDQPLLLADATAGTGTVTVTETVKGSRPTYGEDFVGGAQWDADGITSCVCDGYGSGNRTDVVNGDWGAWTGVGCTIRTCPTGINPAGNRDRMAFEVQRLSCSATGGSFTLTFRSVTSRPIRWDGNVIDLQLALEELGTVGSLQVKEVSGWAGVGRICGTGVAPAVTDITFLTELGDIPLLVVDPYLLDSPSIALTEHVKGWGQLKQCANKGRCSTDDGVCECQAYWYSSNGLGQPGRRGDCGAVEVEGVLARRRTEL